MGQCYSSEEAGETGRCDKRKNGRRLRQPARPGHRRLVYTESIVEVDVELINKGLEPVYVSETIERTMNPTFRHVDWSSCGPGVTRLESFTLRVWARGGKVDAWRQLLELRLDLRSLQFLGRDVRTNH